MGSFEQIKEYFKAKDHARIASGRLPMRSTEAGFWGVSHLDDVKDFFEKKQFSTNTKFLDLGSGDGRVVLVASLYVDAVGVEFDQELVNESRQAAQELGLNVSFICDDFIHVDFSSYDVLYSYADQRWDRYKDKLLSELSGELYCYHDTYHPRFLVRQKTFWANQIPIYCYRNPS